MATSDPTDQNNDAKKQRFTSWTLNNWTPAELELARGYAKLKASYMCWSQEVGEKGTPHLQGYVHWSSGHSLRKFQQDLGGRLHWGDEHGFTNGTPEQNKRYCQGFAEKKGMKLNPTFEEYGEIPKQGERTDWVQALSQIQTGTVLEAIDSQPHLLPCVRALTTYKQMAMKGTHRNVKVLVLVGPPGSGKTRHAWDKFPDLFSKPDGNWWDGYAGQETILLDDYDGHIPYSTLLKICDRYPLVLPVKGGFIPAAYTQVIITSNQMPSLWYDCPIAALERRITECRNQYITDAHQESVQEAHVPQAPRRRVKAVLPPEEGV